MIITIENTTENNINIDEDGLLIFHANSKKNYYDDDSEDTYNIAYYILKIAYIKIKELMDDGSLNIWKDDVKINSGDEFLLFRNKYYKQIFGNTNIKYEKNDGNIWFGLTTNKLYIKNPISKKLFSIELTEEV